MEISIELADIVLSSSLLYAAKRNTTQRYSIFVDLNEEIDNQSKIIQITACTLMKGIFNACISEVLGVGWDKPGERCRVDVSSDFSLINL